MYQKNLVSMSFAQMELTNNRKRLRRLAEIQSQLVLKDLNNNNLTTSLNELKKQNELLKQKLRENDKSYGLIHKNNNTGSAIYRVNDLLNSKIQNTTKRSTNSNQGTFPFAFNYQKINKQNKVNPPYIAALPEKRRTVSFFDNNFNDKRIQQKIKLSKQVYIAHPNLKEQTNLNIAPPKNKKQFSFKKQLKNQSMVELKTNEPVLFQNMNQKNTHKASSRFIECKNKTGEADKSQSYNRWNSEQAQMQINSQMFSQNKPVEHHKRKTFLSIVSQSSRAKQN